MNRLRYALSMAGLALAACTENQSLIILHNVVPTGECVISASPTSLTQPFGVLDVTPLPNFSNPGYVFTPVLQSAAVKNQTDPNAHYIILQGADVSLIAGPSQDSINLIASLAGAQQNQRTQRFSGSVAPGGTASVAYQIIDADQTAAIANLLADGQSVQLIARTSVFGSIDGSDISSPDFDYPVTVCRGCEIELLGPNCVDLTGNEEIQTGGRCNILQDGTLSCCFSGADLVCPAAME